MSEIEQAKAESWDIRALLARLGELEAAAKLHEYGYLAIIAAKNRDLAEKEHDRAEAAEAKLARVVEAAREVLAEMCRPDWGSPLHAHWCRERLRAALAAAEPEGGEAWRADRAAVCEDRERLMRQIEALEHAHEWLAEQGCDCGTDEPGTCALCEVERILARWKAKP